MTTTNNQFRLTLPDGWQDQTVYTFMGPDDSGVKHNLILAINQSIEKNTDLAAYAGRQVEDLKQTLGSLEILKQGEVTLPSSGRRAYEVIYRYTPHDDKVIWQKQITTIIEKKAYLFTASFSKKTIKTMGNEVDAIIESLKTGEEE